MFRKLLTFVTVYLIIVLIAFIFAIGQVVKLMYKTLWYVLQTYLTLVLSDKGLQGLADGVFYGGCFALLLHFTGLSALNLYDDDLMFLITLIVAIKPFERYIRNKSKG